MYAHYRFPQLVFMFFFIFCIFVFLLSAFVFEPGSHSITDICPLLLLPPCILYLYYRFLHFKFQMQNVLSINIMFLLRRGNERQCFITPLEITLFFGHNCTDGCQTAGADSGDWNCPLIWLGSAGWPPIVWKVKVIASYYPDHYKNNGKGWKNLFLNRNVSFEYVDLYSNFRICTYMMSELAHLNFWKYKKFCCMIKSDRQRKWKWWSVTRH